MLKSQMLAVYHKNHLFSALNIPNYVRILPVKNKDIGIKYGNIPPEAKSKAIVVATVHAQSTNALQRIIKSNLYTKHAKLCQDTTC